MPLTFLSLLSKTSHQFLHFEDIARDFFNSYYEKRVVYLSFISGSIHKV